MMALKSEWRTLGIRDWNRPQDASGSPRICRLFFQSVTVIVAVAVRVEPG
jgi:hypothetical protein